MSDALKNFIQALNYKFKNQAFLALALTHRSASSEANNERLEFLGDALLDLIIAEKLYEKFPELDEGQLSRLRANLVNGEILAKIGAEKNVGENIKLGVGETRSGGTKRQSIVAGGIEAIIGAIYLDAGFEVCRQVVLNWYEHRLNQLNFSETSKDPKSRLQEYCQAQKLNLPDYEVLGIEGQAHNQIFHVKVSILTIHAVGHGEGSSRRKAEMQAALGLLNQLEKHDG